MEKFRSGDLNLGILCFFQGSVYISEYIADISGTQSWIPILAAICVSVIMAIIYTGPTNKYKGKNLIDINKIVFGRTMGSVMGWMYLFYFSTIGAFNSCKMGFFFKGSIMPGTPMPVFIIIFLAVCAYGAEKGIVNLIRLGYLLFWTILLVTLMDYLLLIKEMDLSRLLPLFTKGVKNYSKGLYTVLALPILETIVFFMFFDEVLDGKTRKTYLKGIIGGGFLVLAIVVRDILVLGPSVEIISTQTYETLRIINVGNILTRVETLYAFLILIALYFKVTLILCAITKGISQLTGVNNKGITYPIAALVCVYALISFDSNQQLEVFETKAAASFAMPFIFLLPIISFIAVKIKGARE